MVWVVYSLVEIEFMSSVFFFQVPLMNMMINGCVGVWMYGRAGPQSYRFSVIMSQFAAGTAGS